MHNYIWRVPSARAFRWRLSCRKRHRRTLRICHGRLRFRNSSSCVFRRFQSFCNRWQGPNWGPPWICWRIWTSSCRHRRTCATSRCNLRRFNEIVFGIFRFQNSVQRLTQMRQRRRTICSRRRTMKQKRKVFVASMSVFALWPVVFWKYVSVLFEYIEFFKNVFLYFKRSYLIKYV